MTNFGDDWPASMLLAESLFAESLLAESLLAQSLLADLLGARELAALDLVETAPDPVRLSSSDRVIEAVVRDRALPTDGLGEALTSESDLFTLELSRREKGCRVLTATGCPLQPHETIELFVATQGHVQPPVSPRLERALRSAQTARERRDSLLLRLRCSGFDRSG